MHSVIKLLIIIGAFAFSFGILTIGYGFWIDTLDIEGETEVRVRIDVANDILEQMNVTPEAVVLLQNPVPDTADTGVGNAIEQPPVEISPETDAKPEDNIDPPAPDEKEKPNEVQDDVSNPDDTKSNTDSQTGEGSTDGEESENTVKEGGVNTDGENPPTVDPGNDTTGTVPGSI